MYNESLVRIGDALQYREKEKDDLFGGVINFFTLGNRKKKDGHAHTASFIGNGMKAEAHLGKKYGPVPINMAEAKDIDIYRLKQFPDGLNPQQEVIFIRVTERYYGRNYDEVGLVGTLRSSLGKLLGWAGLRNSNPWLNKIKDLFCSEAYATIWSAVCKEPDWLWGHVDVNTKVTDRATTPNDITRSDEMFYVS